MGCLAAAKAEWKKRDFRCRWNVVRVSQEQTLEGRLFQIAEAAERKPLAPREMLQRVTERRLAGADHGVVKENKLSSSSVKQRLVGTRECKPG